MKEYDSIIRTKDLEIESFKHKIEESRYKIQEFESTVRRSTMEKEESFKA